jgi:hypothetical protein
MMELWARLVRLLPLHMPKTDLVAVYWADVGRDILNLVISYIDTPSATPPTSLAPIDASPTLLSLDYPAPGPTDPSARLFRNRLIVGLGHSVGGCGMTYASSAIPSLFSSIILLDPVLPPENSVSRKGRQFMTSGALVRREKWGSREEAKEGFLKKEFFRMWDPRALDRYIEFGLREVVGGVALKATARSEAVSLIAHFPSRSRIDEGFFRPSLQTPWSQAPVEAPIDFETSPLPSPCTSSLPTLASQSSMKNLSVSPSKRSFPTRPPSG